MGGSAWSDDHYKARSVLRSHTAAVMGLSTADCSFAYDHAIRTNQAPAVVHASLDPRGVVFRESRDSDTHPTAIPVAVFLDITGSMRDIPRQVQKNLPRLMGLLIRKGYVEHPAILIGAIGDATCDSAPLQAGQFESGIEIEDNLTNLYMEGGGGGSITESYELALYFMARHTVHDHHEKRERRGYVFIIGDEIPYGKVKKAEVEKIFGDTLDQDIPVSEIMQEVQEKYTVFFLLPKMTNNFGDHRVRDTWKSLVGQNMMILDDPNGICEAIASQVGLCEGSIDPTGVEHDLTEAGVTPSVVDAVSRSLVGSRLPCSDPCADVITP